MSRATRLGIAGAALLGMAAAIGWIPHRWVMDREAPGGISWKAWAYGLSGDTFAGGDIVIALNVNGSQGGTREVRVNAVLPAGSKGSGGRGWSFALIVELATQLGALGPDRWLDACRAWFGHNAPAFQVQSVWWRDQPATS